MNAGFKFCLCFCFPTWPGLELAMSSDRVSLCSTGWPGTQRAPAASASCPEGLKMCTTIPSSFKFLKLENINVSSWGLPRPGEHTEHRALSAPYRVDTLFILEMWLLILRVPTGKTRSHLVPVRVCNTMKSQHHCQFLNSSEYHTAQAKGTETHF